MLRWGAGHGAYRDRGAYEKREEEGCGVTRLDGGWDGEWSTRRTNDVVVPGPDIDIDRVQHAKEGETPANAVNDDLLAALKELVDDRSEEKEVDEGPA